MMTRCNSIFGHKYKPVITKSAAQFPPNVTKIGYEAMKLLRDETFNGVYCERCGSVKGNYDE